VGDGARAGHISDMNQFPHPDLVFLPWLYLPVAVVLIIGLCALIVDDVRRTRRARLVPIPVIVPGEDGGVPHRG